MPLVRRAFGVKRESFLGSGILYSPTRIQRQTRLLLNSDLVAYCHPFVALVLELLLGYFL